MRGIAVQVVERRFEVRVRLEPTRRDWPKLLCEVAGHLDDGRVRDRDLPGLGRALEAVLRSYRWSGAPDLLYRPWPGSGRAQASTAT